MESHGTILFLSLDRIFTSETWVQETFRSLEEVFYLNKYHLHKFDCVLIFNKEFPLNSHLVFVLFNLKIRVTMWSSLIKGGLMRQLWWTTTVNFSSSVDPNIFFRFFRVFISAFKDFKALFHRLLRRGLEIPRHSFMYSTVVWTLIFFVEFSKRWNIVKNPTIIVKSRKISKKKCNKQL